MRPLLLQPAQPPPANVVTTAAGTQGDSDGVTLALSVRLPVTDGDAGEADREADCEADGEADREADSEAALLLERDSLTDDDAAALRDAAADGDHDAERLRESVTELLALTEVHLITAMRRTRLFS